MVREDEFISMMLKTSEKVYVILVYDAPPELHYKPMKIITDDEKYKDRIVLTWQGNGTKVECFEYIFSGEAIEDKNN